MSFSTQPTRCFRLLLLVLLSGWLLLAHTGCHRYHISDPKGPPQPKMKKAKASATDTDQSATADASADGQESQATAHPQHNSYDKQGLLKKKTRDRSRKRKVGQYRFLGIIF